MEIELHCVMCGGILNGGSAPAVCLNCGAEYSNILVSESIPFDGDTVSEMSVSMDYAPVRSKNRNGIPIETQIPVEETIIV